MASVKGMSPDGLIRAMSFSSRRGPKETFRFHRGFRFSYKEIRQFESAFRTTESSVEGKKTQSAFSPPTDYERSMRRTEPPAMGKKRGRDSFNEKKEGVSFKWRASKACRLMA